MAHATFGEVKAALKKVKEFTKRCLKTSKRAQKYVSNHQTLHPKTIPLAKNT
jgi:hypothetical protein